MNTVQAQNEARQPDITTESVMSAIRAYVLTSSSDHFTTVEIAKHMGSSEYPVRAAFSWLSRYRFIEIVPGVRSKRYLGQPENPNKRRHTDSYFASVYRVRDVSEIDFATLMGAFCRGR